MNEKVVVNKDKEEDVLAEIDSFAELPDAPPKRKFRLSWVGWMATGVVAFWLIICLIGPYIAPFHEMDIDGDDSFLSYGDPDYAPDGVSSPTSTAPIISAPITSPGTRCRASCSAHAIPSAFRWPRHCSPT